MKKFALVAVTLVIGIVLGSLLVGGAFAAGPTDQARPTPGVGGNGYGRGGMMGEMRGGIADGVRGGMIGDAGMDDDILALLNMTRDEMIAERQAGKSLVQIAAAKNVTEQQLVDAILADKKAALDKLVADGKLTQARADAMLQTMRTSVTAAVNRTYVGPVWGDGKTAPEQCPVCGEDGCTQTPGNGRPTMPARGGMRGGRGI